MARHDYTTSTPDSLRAIASNALAEADSLVASAVEARYPRTFENTLVPLSNAALAVWNADGRTSFLGTVHPDPTIRDAANEAERASQRWTSELTQRDDVAAGVREYAATAEAASLSGARRRVLYLWLRDLRRSGHGLDRETRLEAARLKARISDLVITFERNLGEVDDALELGPDDLAGLSKEFAQQLPDSAVGAGHKRLPISMSFVWPFIEQSTRRDLRRRALEGFLSRAAAANRPLLEEVMDSRRRLAGLLGFASWSDFANEARMSGSAAAVADFLDGLVTPLQRLAELELLEMRRMLEAEGEPDPQVQPWDWPYLNERQRRALGLDAADLSAHFALGTVLQGLFDLVREVFGVVVTERSDPRGWHPDVRAFDLTDRDTGDRLAHLYLDPFARDGKRPGAWMTTLAEGPTVPGERRERPAIALVSNIVRPPAGVEPLLRHNDVITLFHEFGHVLEFGSSDPEVFPAQFTWVELDFVEAPSQIMEHWVWQPEVLRRLARHHVSGEPPPDALLERLAASRRLNPGISTLWVLGYRSILDQRLHGPDAVDPETAYREAFTVTRLPFPEGTFQPASFSHTMADYDAGFYGYLWAQVFGDDMFGAFLRNGLMSPDLGVRYRREVLEPTWTRTGTDRVRGFLGRESSNRAFLERLGIID